MTDDKMKMVAVCKDQEKATEEDVQAFITHKLQQSRTGKCFLACIYEKVELVRIFNHFIPYFVSINL